MDARSLRRRVQRFADDLERTASLAEGKEVAPSLVAVATQLLEQARQHAGEDPLLRAIQLPERPVYSELIPLLRQVAEMLPEWLPATPRM